MNLPTGSGDIKWLTPRYREDGPLFAVGLHRMLIFANISPDI
jgi:hypothetical protein